MSSYVFTSESVSPGHPDKVADQISDAIVDAHLSQDPNARVAAETLVKDNRVILAGEVSSNASVDYDAVVRNTIKSIGYNDPALGFDAATCTIMNLLGEQSPEIAQGVDREADEAQGAGDQGLMFGYACDETDVFMPAAIYYAHALMRRHAELLHSNELPWLRPDAKSQVSLRFENNKPVGIEALVLSTQHSETISQDDIHKEVHERIFKAVLPNEWLEACNTIHINPTGAFVIGGPVGDSGLTGRKIIVDTYGGSAHHGGGAFSGKDPSKVDRSAAYACRHIAKNLVAAGLAKRCEIQVSYAIGVAEPTSIYLNTYGTSAVDEKILINLVREHFELRPYALIEALDLKRPIYQNTASLGHFGRNEPTFTWENTQMADTLANAIAA